MQKMLLTALGALVLASCGTQAKESASGAETPEITTPAVVFSEDSAYSYIEKQVSFGPRVPNTAAHRQTADWLASELKRHGGEVTVWNADLKAFDGTILKARNIFGRFNPSQSSRILFVAHWDCRPWADQDPDPERSRHPVDGANDGASGVGVLLEIARAAGAKTPDKGVDILFVDAEDWGSDGDEDSWALGARHFVENMPEGYAPESVIILDMVGGTDACFPREYFSQQSDPALLDRIYATAASAGYAAYFPNHIGGAVTDDHVQFIKAGIPAVDIIDYRNDSGFHPSWHTGADDMTAIDKASLKAVGQTMLNLIYPPK